MPLEGESLKDNRHQQNWVCPEYPAIPVIRLGDLRKPLGQRGVS